MGGGRPPARIDHKMRPGARRRPARNRPRFDVFCRRPRQDEWPLGWQRSGAPRPDRLGAACLAAAWVSGLPARQTRPPHPRPPPQRLVHPLHPPRLVRAVPIHFDQGAHRQPCVAAQPNRRQCRERAEQVDRESGQATAGGGQHRQPRQAGHVGRQGGEAGVAADVQFRERRRQAAHHPNRDGLQAAPFQPQHPQGGGRPMRRTADAGGGWRGRQDGAERVVRRVQLLERGERARGAHQQRGDGHPPQRVVRHVQPPQAVPPADRGDGGQPVVRRVEARRGGRRRRQRCRQRRQAVVRQRDGPDGRQRGRGGHVGRDGGEVQVGERQHASRGGRGAGAGEAGCGRVGGERFVPPLGLGRGGGGRREWLRGRSPRGTTKAVAHGGRGRGRGVLYRAFALCRPSGNHGKGEAEKNGPKLCHQGMIRFRVQVLNHPKAG